MLFPVLVLLGAGGALGTPCYNPVPGLDKQSRGVDVTKLDLMPVDPMSAEDGYRSLVVTYTCDQEKQITIDGNTYDVPDQVWSISEIPTGSLTSTVEVQKTSHETRDSMSVNAGLEGTFKKFSFSASTTFSQTQTSLTQSEKTVETASANFGARRVDLQHKDYLDLGNVAQDQLSQLPAQYSSDPIGYEDFVKQFGTHYVSSGKFGGLMMQYMETSSEYIENHSEQTLEVQASASFASVISAHGGTTTSTAETDTEFSQTTTTAVRYYGGNANLLSSDGIASWQPTISSQPWLFSTSLAPISELVRDANRKAALETAIEDYVLRSYLTVELPRLLETLPAVTQIQGEALSLFSKINSMAEKRPLVESEVDALGEEVENGYKEIFLTYHLDNDDFRQYGDYDDPVEMTCDAGKILTHMWSHHDNHREDRIWKFGCNYAPGLPVLTNCEWTGYVNGYDDEFTFHCPNDGFIKGVYSVHDNHHEDRRFKFKCCEADRAATTSCQMSGYVNSYDNDFEYQIDNRRYVIKGVESVHDNHREDRRFKFEECHLSFY